MGHMKGKECKEVCEKERRGGEKWEVRRGRDVRVDKRIE